MVRFEGCENCALNLCCRNTSNGSSFGLQSPQQRRANVEAIAHAVLAGKARTHEVAAIVIKLAHQRGAAFGSFCFSAIGFSGEELLDPVEGLAIDDGLVLAFEPLAAVVNLPKIDAIFEEVGEGTVGEGNAPLVLGDLGATPLGDDASPVEISDQFTERLQFEVAVEDDLDGFRLGLVDDKLLVLTPAKKPRTECCCQPVAFMIAAMAVPFGRRNIASTASCLEDEGAGAFAEAAFVAAAPGAVSGFDWAGPFALAALFAARDDLRTGLADLDFDLLVAIWLSLVSATASGAATDTSPQKVSLRAEGISRISKTHILR